MKINSKYVLHYRRKWSCYFSGQTPLHIAASHGASYETVQLLLMDRYIKPELINKSNETAYDVAKRSSKYYHMFDMGNPALNGIGT